MSLPKRFTFTRAGVSTLGLAVVAASVMAGAQTQGKPPAESNPKLAPNVETGKSGARKYANYPIRVLDYAAKTDIQVKMAASGASAEYDLLILVVRSDEPAFIENALDAMSAVHSSGRTKVGAIVGADGSPKLVLYACGRPADPDGKIVKWRMSSLIEAGSDIIRYSYLFYDHMLPKCPQIPTKPVK